MSLPLHRWDRLRENGVSQKVLGTFQPGGVGIFSNVSMRSSARDWTVINFLFPCENLPAVSTKPPARHYLMTKKTTAVFEPAAASRAPMRDVPKRCLGVCISRAESPASGV